MLFGLYNPNSSNESAIMGMGMGKCVWGHFLSVCVWSDERGACWSGKMRVVCAKTAPTGNRTQGKCLEGIYVTTTPLVLYTYSINWCHIPTQQHTCTLSYTIQTQSHNLPLYTYPSTLHACLLSLTQHFTTHTSTNALPCITKVIILYQTNTLQQCLCHFVHSSFHTANSKLSLMLLVLIQIWPIPAQTSGSGFSILSLRYPTLLECFVGNLKFTWSTASWSWMCKDQWYMVTTSRV